MKQYTKETIEVLSMLYDEIEYAGNDLIIASTNLGLNKNIDIIDSKSREMLYHFNQCIYNIFERFISVHKTKGLAVGILDIINIDTGKSFYENEGRIIRNRVIWNYSVKEDILYLIVSKKNQGNKVESIIYNSDFKIIHKTEKFIDKINIKDENIYYDTKPKGGIYSIRCKINKETGKLIKQKKINRLKILKDNISDKLWLAKELLIKRES